MTPIEFVQMVARMTPYADADDDPYCAMNRLIMTARGIQPSRESRALALIRECLSVEINPANYNHGEVCYLNEAATEAYFLAGGEPTKAGIVAYTRAMQKLAADEQRHMCVAKRAPGGELLRECAQCGRDFTDPVHLRASETIGSTHEAPRG